MPDPIPIAVLARLAVDRSHQGHGFGRALVRDSARRVLYAADAIGIRGILVHAVSLDAKQFYLNLGFDPSPIEPMTLRVTLADLRDTIEGIEIGTLSGRHVNFSPEGKPRLERLLPNPN